MGSDFILKFVRNVDGDADQSGATSIMSLQDFHITGNDARADRNAGAKAYTFSASALSGSIEGFFLDEFDGTSLLHRDSLNKTGNLTWYYEWPKVGNAIELDAWTDSGKGTHISGFPLTIPLTNDIEMPALLPLSGQENATSGHDAYGFIEDLIINYFGASPRTLDFTVADEVVDDNSRLTITSPKATVTAGDRNETWFVYFDVSGDISGAAGAAYYRSLLSNRNGRH